MRILANYGYKTNGDTFSVTFETMGDVPADKATSTVDELFRLAKDAVQRQVKDAGHAPAPAAPETVPVPRPVRRVHVNGNGRAKPVIKDPSLRASSKQLQLIGRLAKEKKVWLEGLENLTMGEASAKIDELMALAA